MIECAEDIYYNKYSDLLCDFRNRLLGSGFTHLGEGYTREGLSRKKMVIKVPINWDGLIDNIIEWKAWRKYRDQPTPFGMYLAPCRLLTNGSLMMARVEPVSWREVPWKLHDPDTGKWLTDGCQAGTYKDRIVAYDYAFEIPERLTWEKELDVCSRWQEDWLPYYPHLKGQ